MKSFLLPVCMRIFEMGKKAAGRQVLLTHTFSFGRSVTVHKSAKDAL